MKILALELSSGRGSIAFVENGAERFAVDFANDRQHSGEFFSQLERALREGCRPEFIVVGNGPGSYAGVRIAISTAIGLAAATGAQLGSVPSICALPTSADEYCVIGDARRQSFYFARIRGGECLEGPLLCPEAALRARLAGVRAPVFTTEPLPKFAEAELRAPSASLLARLAAARPDVFRSGPLEPIYLRPPHITMPKQSASLFNR